MRDDTHRHPGEVLLLDYLIPLRLSQQRLSVEIGVTRRRVNEIVHGRRRITPDTALRLGRYFGMTPQFWTTLQSEFDLHVERRELATTLAQIQPLAERQQRA